MLLMSFFVACDDAPHPLPTCLGTLLARTPGGKSILKVSKDILDELLSKSGGEGLASPESNESGMTEGSSFSYITAKQI